jgi:hypothetical protein
MSSRDDEIAGFLEEIAKKLSHLEATLAHQVTAEQISNRARLPFHVETCRQIAKWRFTELARGAFDGFMEGKMAVALLLTRAAIETCAALWYLTTKVAATNDESVLEELGKSVRTVLLGSRVDPNMLSAINVLTFIGSVEKTLPGTRERYNGLSEYCHPNWAGMLGLYGRYDMSNRLIVLGQDAERKSNAKAVGVSMLSAGFLMFKKTYDDLGESLPALVMLCEKSIEGQSG